MNTNFKLIDTMSIYALSLKVDHMYLVGGDSRHVYWLDTTDNTVYLAESDGSVVLTKSDDDKVNIYENGIVEIDGIFYQCRAATNVFFQPKVNSDNPRLVWDGSIKSTREVIELLGDTVGHDSVSQDYFHDYVDNVRRVGITHTKLGSQILQVGGSLKIADFIEK